MTAPMLSRLACSPLASSRGGVRPLSAPTPHRRTGSEERMSSSIEHRALLSLPLALAALLAASGASAQQREPFALDRFQPAPAGQPFFGVPGPDVLGHADISMMVLGEYARNPLVLSR